MARKIANIYRREDGTYQLRFTVDHRRYAVYGRTVDECRQKETQKRQEIEARAYQRQKDITLGEYAQRWLKGRQGTIEDSTVLSYTTQVNAVIRDPIGAVFLRDLRAQHVRDLIAARREKVAPRTVNLMLVVLNQILDAAVMEEMIPRNPADGIGGLRAPRRAADTDPHRALTREETAAFLKAADARNDAYRDLYRLMLHTGLRIGEVIALVDSDVSGSQVTVSRTVTRSGSSVVMGDGPKTDSGHRIVPLDAAALAAIRSARDYRTAIGVATSRIFVSRTGRGIYAQHVNEQIKKTCELAGIEPITSHALRDSFATRCAESGMQPRVLMELMGHSSIKVTLEIYVHVFDATKVEQLLAVDFGA